MFFLTVSLIWVKSTPKWSSKRCLYYPPNYFLIWGQFSWLSLEIDLFTFFFIFNHKLSSCIDWRRTRSQRKKNIISCGLVLACESIEIRYGLKWISNYEYNIIVTNMENCIFHNSICASYVSASPRGCH